VIVFGADALVEIRITQQLELGANGIRTRSGLNNRSAEAMRLGAGAVPGGHG